MLNHTSKYETEDIRNDPLFISQEFLNAFMISVVIVITGFIALVSAVSNVINMVIFVKMALRDSMTVGLFALSFTDFSVAGLELTISLINLAVIFCPWTAMQLYALAFMQISWAAYAGYLISCWITAIISLERCVCVVFPFKVKQIFNRNRSVFVVFIIYLLIVTNFLPIYIVEKIEWVPLDSQCSNSSTDLEQKICFYAAVFTQKFVDVETALDISAGLVIFISSQLLLFICSTLMTVSLKVSSTVRTQKLSPDDQGTVKKRATKFKLTTQEKRLVKMVLYLSVVQSVCSLPRLTVTIFVHVFTGIDVDKHKNFSTVLWTSAVVFNNVTFSCNSIGYYFLNSAYRRTFRQIFHMRDRMELTKQIDVKYK